MTKDAETIKAGLRNFTGTGQWYRWSPLFRNILLTDGSKYVADECGAYWLMDAIASHQIDPKAAREEFQVWTFKRGTPSTLTMTDGDSDAPVIQQEIGYTDFPLEEIQLWVEADPSGKVILLPSEH